jgi:hypothetical protein
MFIDEDDFVPGTTKPESDGMAVVLLRNGDYAHYSILEIFMGHFVIEDRIDEGCDVAAWAFLPAERDVIKQVEHPAPDAE